MFRPLNAVADATWKWRVTFRHLFLSTDEVAAPPLSRREKMKKLIMAIAIGSLALTGIACGGNPCEDYEAAAADCMQAYADSLATETSEETTEAAGEATEAASTCPSETTAELDDWYQCQADAYTAADCSTADGYMAAGTAAVACAVGAM